MPEEARWWEVGNRTIADNCAAVRAIIVNVPHVSECVQSAVVGEPQECVSIIFCNVHSRSRFGLLCVRASLAFLVIFSRRLLLLLFLHRTIQFGLRRRESGAPVVGYRVRWLPRLQLPRIAYLRCAYACVIYLLRASGFCTRWGRLARPPIARRAFCRMIWRCVFHSALQTWKNIFSIHCKFLNQKKTKLFLIFYRIEYAVKFVTWNLTQFGSFLTIPKSPSSAGMAKFDATNLIVYMS